MPRHTFPPFFISGRQPFCAGPLYPARLRARLYTSLLAIVPLIALGVSVFTSFHAFDEVAGKIRDMLLSNLLPASHEEVEKYLGGIAGKTAALSIFGIIGLLLTATALLNTVEEAFNHIWRITRVPFRFAISGGLIAGALFELMKYAFTFYVTELVHYERLYGALGALPVFLIWLYLIWVVVLMGSEIAFCLQHPEQSHSRHVTFREAGVQQFFTHLILVRAAEALQDGRMLHMGVLARETGVPDNILQEWLDLLCRKGLLHPITDHGVEAWIPV